ncbi:MAG: hypothetical protein AAF415_03335 [Pseudomonadota bacterium]
MRLHNIIRTLGAALSIGAVLPAAAEDAVPITSDQVLSGTPWIMPQVFQTSDNPALQQYLYYQFMWRSFIAVSWPNVMLEIGERDGNPAILSGRRGEPDASRGILSSTGNNPLPLSVWETYREPFEIFLPPEQWADYPDWNDPRPQPKNAPEDARELLRYPTGMTGYATDTNQPYFFPDPTGPLIDQHGNYVRYEVAVNEAFFTYVKHFRYYDAGVQEQAVMASVLNPDAPDGFQPPPKGTQEQFDGGYLSTLAAYPYAMQGLVDVKAAWKVLGPDDRRERYLHRKVWIDNEGSFRDMGLVALHILRFTPEGYVASTFEQVDNTDATFRPYDGLKPSFNDSSPPNAIQARLGFEGDIPSGTLINPEPADIYRVSTLTVGDLSVSAANNVFQTALGDSVFAYYRLIGTQNKRPGTTFTPGQAGLNGHMGSITGVYTNTSELINAALESYSQANFSCILCHVRARPKGVPDQALEEDRFKILTFLLQSAQSE